jgi:putative ABC transport system permease protein
MFFMTSFINALPGAISQGMIWGIMAIGLYITYRVLEVSDLTVDGSFCTGGCTCVMLMLAGYNVWIAMLGAFVAGMLTGLVTGFFHTKCGIPAILAGILTQLGLWSVNLAILGMKANQGINVNNYDLLVSQRYVRELSLNNPLPILLAIVFVLILALYWFFGTERGASLRATGSNPNMARAQGINTNSNIVLGLMLSNGIVAVAGALLAQFQGGADVNNGRGAIVIGLAAVIIGEVLLGKVFRNFGLRLFAVICGAVIYYLVIQIILLIPDPANPGMKLINTNDLKLITAILVGLFLAIPYWSAKVFHGKKKGGKENA